MDTIEKEQAWLLHQAGLSYNEISRKLGISKTRAYEYVKEVKRTRSENWSTSVPNSSELRSERNSERVRNDLPKKKEQETTPTSKAIENLMAKINPLEKSQNNPALGVVSPTLKVKEIIADDLVKKQFECLPFEGKFRELIGRPSKLFSAIIWGLPKGGKSNLAIRFADYLQEYFGKVVYIAAEEGESVSLQEKFKEIKGGKVTIVESRNREAIKEYLSTKECDFVFIDSINNAGIDSDYLETLKEENLKKSFIAIVQATKGGNFKGDQALTHNCDFIIKVVAGVAHHTGRFGPASEIKIFDAPLYEKNTLKAKTVAPIPSPSPVAKPISVKPKAQIVPLGRINPQWLEKLQQQDFGKPVSPQTSERQANATSNPSLAQQRWLEQWRFALKMI